MISTSTFANTCTIVIPLPPGGAFDVYARTMQRINKDVVIEYKPGAYMSQAIGYIESNKQYAILSVPSHYSLQNPLLKEHTSTIEPIRVIASSDQIILSNKDIDLKKLLTEKINIGIPLLGGPQHLIAMQIKEKNPNVEIVPLGGDVKALPVLKLNDVDAYITSSTNALKWIESFNFKQIVRVPAIKSITQNGITLTNVSSNLIFMHKNSSAEQKNNINECIDKIVKSDQWEEALKSMNVTPLDINGKEKDKIIQDYQKILHNYGL